MYQMCLQLELVVDDNLQSNTEIAIEVTWVKQSNKERLMSKKSVSLYTRSAPMTDYFSDTKSDLATNPLKAMRAGSQPIPIPLRF